MNIIDLSYRLKSGPHGPSILTSHLDCLALFKNKLLMHSLYSMMKIQNGIWCAHLFMNNMNALILNRNESSLDLREGKISLTSEPAGKTRLFAIVNF
jgi:hypothetical protein